MASLRFYNTLSKSLQDFVPINPPQVRMYTCGPTVYNFAHIGNFRAYAFEDILRRTLQYFGYQVVQVMNLTDVDDKTIRGSRSAGVPLHVYTQPYKDAFFEDLKTLRIQKAEFYPAATEHIEDMIRLIQKLLDKGLAYQGDDGSIYFSIRKFPSYGKLANISIKDQKVGVRIHLDEYDKEEAADFALWKSWDEEDGDVWWESPWGKGRPGWHIECSAMSMRYLGEHFDIHTGGVDNIFPHHEDEIAQSEGATGKPFVNYWLHCEHLMVNNRKMAKREGNFFTLRDLLQAGFSGREIRWLLIGCNYRQKLNFVYHPAQPGHPPRFESLENARNSLQRLDEWIQRLQTIAQDPQPSIDLSHHPTDAILHQLQEEFRNCLADDLNIAGAIGALFTAVREIHKLIDHHDFYPVHAQQTLQLLRDFDQVLDVFTINRHDTQESLPPLIQELLEKRNIARKNRDYTTADQIRDQLRALGWQVKDTPKGAVVTRYLG